MIYRTQKLQGTEVAMAAGTLHVALAWSIPDEDSTTRDADRVRVEATKLFPSEPLFDIPEGTFFGHEPILLGADYFMEQLASVAKGTGYRLVMEKPRLVAVDHGQQKS